MKAMSVGHMSALIYTSISVVVAGTFLVITLLGNYDWMTRLGGTAWVFMLCMIILMPLTTQWVKRRHFT